VLFVLITKISYRKKLKQLSKEKEEEQMVDQSIIGGNLG
jgi:hypothetical protein